MGSSLGLTRSLRSLVTSKFNQARHAKDVIFSETQLTVLTNPGMETFQLRYLPSLANKPVDDRVANKPASSSDKTKPRFDPFDNPPEQLLVARLPADDFSHNIVLNKFPVIPNHFILATKENKPQTFPLEKDDLFLTYQCIRAWTEHEPSHATPQSDDKTSPSLFAFFNSGRESGASQPHRHIQFLPVADMTGAGSENWSILVDSMTTVCRSYLDLLHNPTLPFVHYAVDIDASISAEELHEKYIFLLRASAATTLNDVVPLSKQDIDRCPVTWIADWSHDPPDGEVIAREDETMQNEVMFDYNLCLTNNKMAIVPRLRGDVKVRYADREDPPVSINGTILAGTLMTKSEKHWHTLRDRPELLHDLLLQIGYIKPAGALGERNNLRDKL